MNYVITESQMQLIITESTRERLSESMSKISKVSKKIIDDVISVWGLNFKFLLTWGASIGGMMAPLKSWVEGEMPELSEYQVSLLVLSAVAQYYYDNERKLKTLYGKIVDEGLEEEFQVIQLKADKLRRIFFDFLVSVGITTTSLINTMSYAFIIPILEDLYNLSLAADNTGALITLVGKRLLASGTMVVTGSVLNTMIKKLVKKFQQKS